MKDDIDVFRKALCKGSPKKWFSEHHDPALSAIKTCQDCSCIESCTKLADTTEDKHGVWAGRYYINDRPLVLAKDTGDYSRRLYRQLEQYRYMQKKADLQKNRI